MSQTQTATSSRAKSYSKWELTSFTRKEHEMVEEAKQHFLNVVRLISLIHNTAELEERWKLFYYGFEPAMCAQAGVSTLVNWQSVRIPLGGRVCMLRLKLLGRSLYLLNAMAVQLESDNAFFGLDYRKKNLTCA